MTSIVVRVLDLEDVDLAVASGADVVEADPRSESLQIQVCETVGGRLPVIAATDVWTEYPPYARRVDVVGKAVDIQRVHKVVNALPAVRVGGERLARVIADEGLDEEVVLLLAARGFSTVVVDTGTGAPLLDRLDVHRLRRLVTIVRMEGMKIGFAGALEAPDVPRLLVLKPDFLVFGPTRQDGRWDPDTLAHIVRTVKAKPGTDVARTDRIFVRDILVEMQIGAYDHERGRTQRVRFSVEVDVVRPEVKPTSMDGIYSYDMIMDGVKYLVARGHTDLVETLAEELAEMVLADPRVVSTVVKVEKLDLGPGAVGVEIRRP